MKILSLGLTFALLTVLFVCSASCDNSFDYFVFALTWPGNACKELNPCYIPNGTNDFTIHGLWPSRNSGPLGPFFCGGTFDPSQIQDLESDLNTYWTDFKNDIPNFWKHEYEKHGTCAAQLPRFSNEYKFFKGTIELRKSIQPLAVLQKSGIVPSDSRYYHESQIKDAFAAGGLGRPALACYHNAQALTEVRFCTDKNLNFMDCPSSMKNQCHDTVTLNPIASRR
ncbi:hypothetical protein ABK040_011904 [Willaertia magna]